MKGVLFDLDGTLLDTMPAWEALGKTYLRSKSITPPENINQILKTMSLPQAARYFQKQFGLQFSERQIIADINQIITDLYRYTAPLKDSVLPFLDNLYKRQIKMGILTASDKKLAKTALTRLKISKYFSFILTCEEFGSCKDQAGIFEEGLKKLLCSKNETVVFEDAYHAILTAKNAGFYVVGVSDPANSQDKGKIQNIADQWIDSFDEFKEI